MKFHKYRLLLPAVGILIVLAVIGVASRHRQPAGQFALPDKTLANGQVELCSDYARLCFTRPADWTRSSILHAGTAKNNNIEINPPTGTIFRFEAIDKDTAETCNNNPGDICSISIVKTAELANHTTMASGIFKTTATKDSTVEYFPFVELMSAKDLQTLGLQAGKTKPYTSFNVGVSIASGRKVLLQISPGRSTSIGGAEQWLTSSEATTASQILSSVRQN